MLHSSNIFLNHILYTVYYIHFIYSVDRPHPQIVPILIGKLSVPTHWQDERGVDGVVIVPEGNKKKVLIGTRMASTKEKESEHADRDGHEEAFEKAAATLDIEGQTKDPS